MFLIRGSDKSQMSLRSSGLGLIHGRFPGAAQHAVMRCRPGIVPSSEFATIPDQRCTAIALHRVRETVPNRRNYRMQIILPLGPRTAGWPVCLMHQP
jgi:hypothetical protein